MVALLMDTYSQRGVMTRFQGSSFAAKVTLVQCACARVFSVCVCVYSVCVCVCVSVFSVCVCVCIQ